VTQRHRRREEKHEPWMLHSGRRRSDSCCHHGFRAGLNSRTAFAMDGSHDAGRARHALLHPQPRPARRGASFVRFTFAGVARGSSYHYASWRTERVSTGRRSAKETHPAFIMACRGWMDGFGEKKNGEREIKQLCFQHFPAPSFVADY
jgi:hypothetical protein